LSNAATAGDTITTISFYVSSVLNAIPATAGSVAASYLAGGAALSNIGSGGITQTYLATGVAGTGPSFSAYCSSSQTLSSGTFTKIQFQTKEWDTTTAFSGSTTYTPLVAGYYQVSAAVSQIASYTNVAVALYKNGSAYKFLYNGPNSNSSGGFGSAMVYLNGSTDYIEIYASFSTGQGTVNAQKDTYFQAAMVRSA
jgi:hypothetical protein